MSRSQKAPKLTHEQARTLLESVFKDNEIEEYRDFLLDNVGVVVTVTGDENSHSKFGFITTDEEGPDIFFNPQALHVWEYDGNAVPVLVKATKRFYQLKYGTVVTFSAIQKQKGVAAEKLVAWDPASFNEIKQLMLVRPYYRLVIQTGKFGDGRSLPHMKSPEVLWEGKNVRELKSMFPTEVPKDQQYKVLRGDLKVSRFPQIQGSGIKLYPITDRSDAKLWIEISQDGKNWTPSEDPR